MPNDRPLVSVITAVFNNRDNLGSCIESVLAQNYPNIEHIVLDGGSTDGTLDVLREYSDRLAYWNSEPDQGVFDAWNKALQVAKGEWIAFLGSDDIFLPDAVECYMDLAHANPQAEFLSSTAQLKHPSGYAPVFGAPWQWPKFAKAMTTVHVGSMHRRTLFEKHGNFDISYRIAGDYEWMLRAGDQLKTAFTSETTVVMQAGGLSDSTAGLYEAKRAKLKNKVRSPLRANCELRELVLRFHLRRIYLKYVFPHTAMHLRTQASK